MNATTQQPMRGQCLCGGIEYQVERLESKMGHCHCRMCRKFHGAAFATYGEAKQENFRWLQGQALLQSFTAPNGTTRQFCKNCGSSMIFISAASDGSLVEFALGTLDCEPTAKPDVHIYTEHKAAWFEITDGLPQFDNGRE